MPQSAITINLRKVNTLLFLLLIVGAVTYFLTTNNLSTRGFAFKELKEKVTELKNEQQRMENQMTLLASYQSLNPRIQELRLVASTDVHYIDWNSFLVARR